LAIKARVLATVARLVAVLLVPIVYCRAPGRARFLACQWALGLRFPAEDLRGLAPETLTAFSGNTAGNHRDRGFRAPPAERGRVRRLQTTTGMCSRTSTTHDF
jgi:hypothetical protein